MGKGVFSHSRSSLNTISEEECVCSLVCVGEGGEVRVCLLCSWYRGFSPSHAPRSKLSTRKVCVHQYVCVFGGAGGECVSVFTSVYVCVAVSFHDNMCGSEWGLGRACVVCREWRGEGMCACACICVCAVRQVTLF